MGFDIFTVDHSRNGRYVETCLFRNVLQDHRFQMGLVTVDEIVMLIIYDCLHGAGQGIVTLLDSLYKPFCGIQFLLHECGGFLLFPFR